MDKELKEKLRKMAEAGRTYWNGRDKGDEILFEVHELKTVHSDTLNKEIEIFEGKDLETGAIVTIPAFGYLKHHLELGKKYYIRSHGKMKKGYLFDVIEIPEDIENDKIPF